MNKFHTINLILGVVLLVVMIWSIRPLELWRDPGRLCSGLLAFILIDGIAGVLFTIGWRNCLSSPHRELPFSPIYRIYLAGSAINYLTPTAALGGELTKASLLSRWHEGPEAATAVIIGKLAHALAQLLVITLGSLTILGKVQLPFQLLLVMVGASVIIGAGILTFFIVQRAGRLGGIIYWLVRHKLGGAPLRKAAFHVNRVDQALKGFYAAHPKGLPSAVFWHMTAVACGMAQYWLFFRLFDPFAPLSVVAGVWLIGSWLDLAAFALPNDIGILEGTRVIAFTALGFGASLGLTYGIIYRLAQIFWGAAGLFLYATLLSQTRRLPKREEISS